MWLLSLLNKTFNPQISHNNIPYAHISYLKAALSFRLINICYFEKVLTSITKNVSARCLRFFSQDFFFSTLVTRYIMINKWPQPLEKSTEARERVIKCEVSVSNPGRPFYFETHSSRKTTQNSLLKKKYFNMNNWIIRFLGKWGF